MKPFRELRTYAFSSQVQVDKPWVVLVRDPMCYTTAAFLERALAKICNLISIHFDIRVWLPDSVGLYAEGVIRRLGVRIPIDLSKWIPPGINKKIDLFLVVDPIRLPFNLKSFRGITAYYAIDGNNPLTFDGHFRFAKVDEYDYVFVASKNDPERYRKRGCKNVYWLPLACDPDFHKRYIVPLRYDVCFVGEVEWQGRKIIKGIDYDARKRLINLLKRKFNTYVGKHYLHDMALTYSQSKIVFNMVKLDGLNMRIFEALGCGRLLVTNRVDNGVKDLFIDRKELVLYNDANDLISLIQYYLDNEDERENIAQRGQEKVYAKHTYYHRAKALLQKVGFNV